jgi:hypothetical protein
VDLVVNFVHCIHSWSFKSGFRARMMQVSAAGRSYKSRPRS